MPDRREGDLQLGRQLPQAEVELAPWVWATEPSVHEVAQDQAISGGLLLGQPVLDPDRPPRAGLITVGPGRWGAPGRPPRNAVIVYHRNFLYSYPLAGVARRPLPPLGRAGVDRQVQGPLDPPGACLRLRHADQGPGDGMGGDPLPGHDPGQQRLALAPAARPLPGLTGKHPAELGVMLAEGGQQLCVSLRVARELRWYLRGFHPLFHILNSLWRTRGQLAQLQHPRCRSPGPVMEPELGHKALVREDGPEGRVEHQTAPRISLRAQGEGVLGAVALRMACARDHVHAVPDVRPLEDRPAGSVRVIGADRGVPEQEHMRPGPGAAGTDQGAQPQLHADDQHALQASVDVGLAVVVVEVEAKVGAAQALAAVGVTPHQGTTYNVGRVGESLRGAGGLVPARPPSPRDPVPE